MRLKHLSPHFTYNKLHSSFFKCNSWWKTLPPGSVPVSFCLKQKHYSQLEGAQGKLIFLLNCLDRCCLKECREDLMKVWCLPRVIFGKHHTFIRSSLRPFGQYLSIANVAAQVASFHPLCQLEEV